MSKRQWRGNRTLLLRLRVRDGDNCYLCGVLMDFSGTRDIPHAASLDHIQMRKDGGTNHAENFKLAHRHCNTKRGNIKTKRGFIIALLNAIGRYRRNEYEKQLWKDFKEKMNESEKKSR